MALIHPKSCECFHSGLDLFSVPPTQTAVEEGQFVEVRPIAALTQGAPIEFVVQGNGEEYLDLYNTFLHLRAKITLPTGENIPAAAEVAPVNYYMNSLISQIDVSLNDTLITASENTYAYRAYIEAVLNYGEEAKRSYMTCALFYADTPPYLDDTQGNNNEGLKIRRLKAKESRELDMMGRLHSDIFTQQRYMLNGVDVKVKLTPTKDAFNLIAPNADTEYKSVITYAALLVRKAKVNPAISLAHEKALLQSNSKYPLKRVVVKTMAVPTGMLSYNQDNLFLSQTPTRLVVGLVEADAFNGSYNTNPLNFKHFNLTYLSVNVEGRPVTGKPLILDYERNHYARAFFGTNLALGLIGKDAGNDITYFAFKHGEALYAFDLSPSLLDGEQFEMAKTGALSVELKFATPTVKPIQLIIYAELDSVIEISKTRQVLTDYSA